MQHPMKPPLLDRTSGSGNLARRGAVVLELLIALPLLVIGSMAAVEMGLWMAGQERLEMAARIGADRASMGYENPLETRNAVEICLRQAHLYQANLQDLQVLIIDNIGGNIHRYPFPNEAAWSDFPQLENPQSDSPFVRVVVRLPSSALAPNMLKAFGFDLDAHWSVRAKTYRYQGS